MLSPTSYVSALEGLQIAGSYRAGKGRKGNKRGGKRGQRTATVPHSVSPVLSQSEADLHEGKLERCLKTRKSEASRLAWMGYFMD